MLTLKKVYLILPSYFHYIISPFVETETETSPNGNIADQECVWEVNPTIFSYIITCQCIKRPVERQAPKRAASGHVGRHMVAIEPPTGRMAPISQEDPNQYGGRGRLGGLSVARTAPCVQTSPAHGNFGVQRADAVVYSFLNGRMPSLLEVSQIPANLAFPWSLR